MGKADLNTTKERRDASAVGREVGEISGHKGRGGDGGLQHANEGIAVDRLDHLQKEGLKINKVRP